jgi:uncharacterized protein (TIGR03086 family)
MDLDLLDLYKRSSDWAAGKVAGATGGDLSGSTPCSDWTVRDLLNHMLETQRYFAGAGRGEQVSPPGQTPPDTLSDDPRADFTQVREDVIAVYSEDGVIEKTMPALGIAFADALLHGWDLAKATGQDATMPDDLADAAYRTIHGRFSDEQRQGVFGPEIQVSDDASAQERLLAYVGRREG